jgi:hypothetical protein
MGCKRGSLTLNEVNNRVVDFRASAQYWISKARLRWHYAGAGPPWLALEAM